MSEKRKVRCCNCGEMFEPFGGWPPYFCGSNKECEDAERDCERERADAAREAAEADEYRRY